MPNRIVTVRLWEVVVAFVIVVGSAAGSAQWANWHTNNRIDDAEKRITANTTNIAEARVQAASAEQMAAIATELSDSQARTIKVLCGEITAVKGQIVATLRSSSGSAQTLVGRIPGYTEADARRAEMRLQAALRRFAPRPCPPKVPR